MSSALNDNLNDIRYVYYSMNAGDWEMVYPVDNICDSEQESFQIAVKLENENEIAIKAIDAVENVSVFHFETK